MGHKIDLIYEDLTYEIIGILFGVFNDLGYGYQEKYYQNATAILLGKKRLKFKEQVYVPLNFKGNKIGKYFLDFLIEDKIILEIKKGEKFYKSNITQVFSYLRASDLKLGIIANFTKSGVKVKRIVNINP
jgi:GxxExxY protein